jgi:hypothetical protein
MISRREWDDKLDNMLKSDLTALRMAPFDTMTTNC